MQLCLWFDLGFGDFWWLPVVCLRAAAQLLLLLHMFLGALSPLPLPITALIKSGLQVLCWADYWAAKAIVIGQQGIYEENPGI